MSADAGQAPNSGASPVDAEFRKRLEALRADFAEVTGAPFEHFYCPILFMDEGVQLCRAHIVNEAFPNSHRRWTVQRKDVDDFYGSAFEADFLGIRYMEGGLTPDQVLANADLSRQLRPTIAVRGAEVPHYRYSPGDIVPPSFSRLELETESARASLVLKRPPSELMPVTMRSDDLRIEINCDLRLPALVSLVKAAHLTLFEMLGYRYALSAGGYFTGKTMLGDFFLQSSLATRRAIQKEAIAHFSEVSHLVRPVVRGEADRLGIQGTTRDRQLWICGKGPTVPWAFIVFIRTSELLQAVLCPAFSRDFTAHQFYSFLHNDEIGISYFKARYEGNHWLVSPKEMHLEWPKPGTASH